MTWRLFGGRDFPVDVAPPPVGGLLGALLEDAAPPSPRRVAAGVEINRWFRQTSKLASLAPIRGLARSFMERPSARLWFQDLRRSLGLDLSDPPYGPRSNAGLSRKTF